MRSSNVGGGGAYRGAASPRSPSNSGMQPTREKPRAADPGRSVARRRHCHFDCRERAVDSGKSREAITGRILRTEAIIQP